VSLRGLSSGAKWALIMMLVAMVAGVIGPLVSTCAFGQAPPPFVYVLPGGWLVLFLVGLARIRVALVGGIVWAVLDIVLSAIMMVDGVEVSVAAALGVPVSPFAVLSVVVSAVVFSLCVRSLKQGSGMAA